MSETASNARPQAKGETLGADSKQGDVRMSNIIAAKAVADAVRTSLGPRGMDKMIQAEKGEVLITNDGATILGQIQVLHPAARMLVELSKAQDIEAGDGTTSVVVLAGALLDACTKLLGKGIHSTTIADTFLRCADKAEEILRGMAVPVSLDDRDSMIRAAMTSLSSKVVSNNSQVLAPIAVDSVLRVSDPSRQQVDLRDIHILKQLGGTIDDSELVEGLVFPKPSDTSVLGVTRVVNAKIGLIQFHLSAPKTDIDNKVIINDYTQMDRLLREERKYILEMCKKIKKAGCNVVLVQKSILRDAVNELSLHFLSKLKIMVISDVEREDIEFISRTLGCRPVAHIDSFTEDKLGHADLVEEVDVEGRKITKITGVANPGKTVSLLLRGSNKLVLDESERSLHDALCVVRCLVKKPYLLVGGGAPESEIYAEFQKWIQTLTGADRYIARAFAEALEIIPYTLAENAGLHPISIVTELRQRHQAGEKYAGIDVKKGCISNMMDLGVIQPLLVSSSAIHQATEYVHMMLKIDDMVATLKMFVRRMATAINAFRADVHMHTNLSDGKMSVRELLTFCKQRQLDYIAITDHDTVNGVLQLESQTYDGMVVIPGIEMSSYSENEKQIHVTGYFPISADFKSFQSYLNQFVFKRRVERCKRILSKLEESGYPVPYSMIEERTTTCAPSLPIIADCLVSKKLGYSKNFRDSFDSFLGDSAPFNEPLQLYNLKEAIDIIHSYRGVAAIAHPWLCGNPMQVCEEALKCGVNGLECFPPAHREEHGTTQFVDFANQHQLFCSSGSDYHALGGEEVLPGDNVFPINYAKQFIDYLTKQKILE